MKQELRFWHQITLLLLITFASVAGLLFIPALPELDNYFGISNTKAQWILSIFLVGYCLGQLPYGPLANRWGRKNTIYCGVVLAIIGSFLSYLAPTFSFLCVARFIQALGAAVGLKMSFTIISDLFVEKEASKITSLLSLAFGVMPGLSVATGSLIISYSSWRACFLFLTGYSLIIGIAAYFLPETVKKFDVKALKVKNILRGYETQFLNKNLILNGLIVSLSTMMIYIFATIAPYLGIERLKMTLPEFGLWNIIPASGLVAGAFLSRSLAMKYSLQKNLFLGMSISFCGICLMTLCFSTGFLMKATLFFSQFVIQSGYNLIWANANTLALSTAHDKSNAASIVQFINVGGSVLGTFFMGLFSPTATMLLPFVFGGIIITMCLVFLRTLKLRSG